MFNQVYEKEIKLSEIKERAFSVIPTKVGIHNDLKMLVLDLIGDWIPVCTGMTI